MEDRAISWHYILLISLLQIFLLTLPIDGSRIVFKVDEEYEGKNCTAPNGSTGICLSYNKCRDLTQWKVQNNLRNKSDLLKMFCGNSRIIVCCNQTNPYYSDSNYISKLNPKGLAILEAVECSRPKGDRISKGKKVAMGEYPFMATLEYNVEGRRFLCAGTLLTSRFVLTAAHCIHSHLISVRLGEHDLSTEIDCTPSSLRLCLPKPEDYKIEKTIIHPDYMKPRFANDIALIKLDRDVIRTVNTKPICLPITQLVYDNSDSIDYYKIAGWGRTENGTNTDVLQHAEIPHQKREVCQNIFKQAGVEITDNQICAGGENEVDTCKGDSGGPLFAMVPFTKLGETEINRQVQFGIVSFGLSGCGGKTARAAVYTNLFSFMPWITDIIANNA
ncbi:venom protease [Ceratitis capitata]|uniref:CLIP domain-containing serine protease n=2 Tax=Ceratitis capitata TaxID=7213 RepID=W8CD66_CERCA|nr:venom protease [Ceratitis capitata]